MQSSNEEIKVDVMITSKTFMRFSFQTVGKDLAIYMKYAINVKNNPTLFYEVYKNTFKASFDYLKPFFIVCQSIHKNIDIRHHNHV